MKKLIGLLSGLLLFGACATQTLPAGGASQEAMISACNAYSSALTQLATAPLTPSDISQVNSIRAIINPICVSPTSYQIPGLIQQVNTEAQQILTLYAIRKGKP